MEFWRGKRVFITGHTGFKGTWLSKILELAGARVTGYALAPESEPNLYEIAKPGIDSVIGDIRDYKYLEKAYLRAAPEIVLHMAAQAIVLESYAAPRYTYETNLMGTVNILECARMHGARSVLIVTTDKVYQNLERERGYTEDERLDGHDPYSNSKSCCELAAATYDRSFLRENGIAMSTARSGNVIGGGDFAANRLIPDCARAASKAEPAIIRNPFSIRPYQHVLDTLFAYLLIAHRQYDDIGVCGAYNIGPDINGGSVTSGELAESFCKAYGPPASWRPGGGSPAHKESGLLTLDCSKIGRRLGWRPKWGIEEAVQKTARWYAQYYGGGKITAMDEQIDEFLRDSDESNR